MYKRSIYAKIVKRIKEKRRFIQVLTGPRQTGKTTLMIQIMNELNLPVHYASADEPIVKDRIWLIQQWEKARLTTKEKKGLLILDEIQKITEWSETVKWLWDEDTIKGINLQVVILGSSTIMVQKGLSESLAGRFEIIPVTHWSFQEMRDAFGWDLEQYLYFGGYPGSAGLIDDEQRWRNYIKESIIETSISRDILLMNRVDKPALLRRLFELGCYYSCQILSYQKMLGQLQDAGNTTTLAHYLNLLESAGLIKGIQKYSTKPFRRKGSSPKFVIFNTALISALHSYSFEKALTESDYRGRLVESSIGSHLINSIRGTDIKLYYWRERNREVDFVLTKGSEIIAIEVKGGRRRDNFSGLRQFAAQFNIKKSFVIGIGGIPIGEFLTIPVEELF